MLLQREVGHAPNHILPETSRIRLIICVIYKNGGAWAEQGTGYKPNERTRGADPEASRENARWKDPNSVYSPAILGSRTTRSS